jgi:glutathione S-transferase
MKLIYSSAGSPFARKVRIVLHEKGLAYEEDVRPGLRPVEELKELNPNLALPVLQDREHTLFGSNLIIEYLFDSYPGTASRGTPPFAERMTRPGQHWQGLKILATIEAFADTMVNVRHFRGEGTRGDTSRYMARQEARMNSCLDWLEEQMTPLGFWPGVFSVMDLALICPLDYAETRGVLAWRGRAKLAGWYQYWQMRPSVMATAETPLPAAKAG